MRSHHARSSLMGLVTLFVFAYLMTASEALGSPPLVQAGVGILGLLAALGTKLYLLDLDQLRAGRRKRREERGERRRTRAARLARRRDGAR